MTEPKDLLNRHWGDKEGLVRVVWWKQEYYSITIIWGIESFNIWRILDIKWYRKLEYNGISYVYIAFIHCAKNLDAYSTVVFYSKLGGVVTVDQWEFSFTGSHFLWLPTFLCETIIDAKSDRSLYLYILNSFPPLMSHVCLSSHNCEFY